MERWGLIFVRAKQERESPNYGDAGAKRMWLQRRSLCSPGTLEITMRQYEKCFLFKVDKNSHAKNQKRQGLLIQPLGRREQLDAPHIKKTATN